jgi:hypothetical protein
VVLLALLSHRVRDQSGTDRAPADAPAQAIAAGSANVRPGSERTQRSTLSAEPAASAEEKLGAEIFLQLADMAADGGMGDEEFACGLSKTHMPGGSFKSFEGIEGWESACHGRPVTFSIGIGCLLPFVACSTRADIQMAR